MTMQGILIRRSQDSEADRIAELLQRGRTQVWSPYSVSTAFTGSGGLIIRTGHMQLRTGTTNPSTALCNSGIVGLGGGSVNSLEVNWDKDLRIFMIIAPQVTTANTTFRWTLTNGGNAPQLVAKGVELELANLALVGASYNSARVTIAMGTLTDYRDYLIEIRHNAGTGTAFYLDGVLKGTNTGTGLPSGSTGSTDDEVSWYIRNGSSADDAQVWITPPIFWQER